MANEEQVYTKWRESLEEKLERLKKDLELLENGLNEYTVKNELISKIPQGLDIEIRKNYILKIQGMEQGIAETNKKIAEVKIIRSAVIDALNGIHSYSKG